MFLGTVITSAVRQGPHAITVTFDSSHTGRHQLYVGRTLAAVTGFAAERRMTAQIDPGLTPPPLQVVAVDGSEVATDFGSLLPDRPYNRHRLTWDATGIEADTDRFRITGATAIDTDPTEFLGAVQYTAGVTAYSFDTPPIEASGDWRFGVTPYDSACGEYADDMGNAGTQALATVTAEVYPPDVALQSDRQRFAASATGGTLTVDFDYQN
jgi:hypothetical protein